jgi:hypothetical protein
MRPRPGCQLLSQPNRNEGERASDMRLFPSRPFSKLFCVAASRPAKSPRRPSEIRQNADTPILGLTQGVKSVLSACSHMSPAAAIYDVKEHAVA